MNEPIQKFSYYELVESVDHLIEWLEKEHNYLYNRDPFSGAARECGGKLRSLKESRKLL